MGELENLKTPNVAGVGIEVGPGARVRLSGSISTREPDKNLGRFFRDVHEAAVASRVTVLTVDVCDLSFVNSSGIRLFIDWASRAANQAGHRYRLTFIRNSSITWQRVSFPAIKNIAGDIVLEEGARPSSR